MSTASLRLGGGSCGVFQEVVGSVLSDGGAVARSHGSTLREALDSLAVRRESRVWVSGVTKRAYASVDVVAAEDRAIAALRKSSASSIFRRYKTCSECPASCARPRTSKRPPASPASRFTPTPVPSCFRSTSVSNTQPSVCPQTPSTAALSTQPLPFVWPSSRRRPTSKPSRSRSMRDRLRSS